ncbi:MAG: glycosyltransferase, partial [Actinomycetota bacterium]|nr:glycosyltransferase [Actinomycetota bacterium]
MSIGLPTYNRAALLPRAVESALAQDYTNLELIISDNASTDGTPAVCVAYAGRDRRVRYIRQPVNNGAMANFNAVLAAARGSYFMWLADDDWLDRAYIAKCLPVLLDNPDYVLACGKARYFRGESFVCNGAWITLPQNAPRARVLAYYRQVVDNGMFYGLLRRESLAHVRFRHIFGGDIYYIAGVVLLGKARTLDDVSINRSLAGGSEDIRQLARSYGLHPILAHYAYWVEAWNAFTDLAWRSPVYRRLGRLGRAVLGIQV